MRLTKYRAYSAGNYELPGNIWAVGVSVSSASCASAGACLSKPRRRRFLLSGHRNIRLPENSSHSFAVCGICRLRAVAPLPFPTLPALRKSACQLPRTLLRRKTVGKQLRLEQESNLQPMAYEAIALPAELSRGVDLAFQPPPAYPYPEGGHQGGRINRRTVNCNRRASFADLP